MIKKILLYSEYLLIYNVLRNFSMNDDKVGSDTNKI
mgnify:CR=1 FL=1